MGLLLLLLVGFFDSTLILFPVNMDESTLTLIEKIHVIIVIIIGILTTAGVIMFWIGSRKTNLKTISKFSLFSGIILILSWPLKATSINSPIDGLIEKVPVGAFLLWIFTISIILANKKITYYLKSKIWNQLNNNITTAFTLFSKIDILTSW